MRVRRHGGNLRTPLTNNHGEAIAPLVTWFELLASRSTEAVSRHGENMDDKIVRSPTSPDGTRFDRWAATYEQSFLQRWYFDPVHSKMLDLLARAGPKNPPSCILDVGCGTGRLLRAASVSWPAARLMGVDPAPRMVAEAQRLAPNAIFEIATAEALPFPDQSADLVLSSLSFHHWADQNKGLQEIARVLRPGGSIVQILAPAAPLTPTAGCAPSVRQLFRVHEGSVGTGALGVGNGKWREKEGNE